MTALVVAQHAGGRVAAVTRELVSAGAALGPVTVAVVAAEPEPLLQQVDVEGVAEIVAVRADTDAFEPDIYERAVTALVEERRPLATLVPFTVDGIGYGPAVAARLGLGFASDVHGLALEDGQLVATRSFYGGRVHGELEFPGADSVVLLLRAGMWPAASGRAGAPVSERSAPAGRSRIRHLELIEPETTADADLAEARFLLAIGRAVEDAAGVDRFRELAERMGATLAASRPLIDQGLLPRSRQVGQSGKTVKPTLYFAFGISGAVQHLAGIRSAETIVAVNLDPEAPIFDVAHYGAVADIYDVADELAKLW